MMHIKSHNNIVTLDRSLNPLKDQFNSYEDKLRFIALLSPTCPLWRDQGTRAVHEILIEQFPDADIRAAIVWIPMLDNDTIEAASPYVKFLSDKKFQHFYDQHQNVGKLIANSVGWIGKIAWDIYLFYEPYIDWIEMPPKPKYWMHQLTDDWAKNDKYRTGKDLQNELSISMKKLLNNYRITKR